MGLLATHMPTTASWLCYRTIKERINSTTPLPLLSPRITGEEFSDQPQSPEEWNTRALSTTPGGPDESSDDEEIDITGLLGLDTASTTVFSRALAFFKLNTASVLEKPKQRFIFDPVSIEILNMKRQKTFQPKEETAPTLLLPTKGDPQSCWRHPLLATYSQSLQHLHLNHPIIKKKLGQNPFKNPNQEGSL